MTTDLNKLLLANELRMAIADAPKSLRDYVEQLTKQRDELLTLLEEGATGFGRILVATSDDAAVRDWQKRAKAAIAKMEEKR